MRLSSQLSADPMSSATGKKPANGEEQYCGELLTSGSRGLGACPPQGHQAGTGLAPT